MLDVGGATASVTGAAATIPVPVELEGTTTRVTVELRLVEEEELVVGVVEEEDGAAAATTTVPVGTTDEVVF